MKKEIIATEKAPAAVGPYSQAIKVGNILYTAGQIGIDPGTGKMVSGGVKAQTEQVLKNLGAVLQAAGTGFEHVVKTTIFLRFMKDFGAVNQIYAGYVSEQKPARSTVAVASLPLSALVEIEAIALIPGESAQDKTRDKSEATQTDIEMEMGKKKKKKNKKNKKKGKK